MEHNDVFYQDCGDGWSAYECCDKDAYEIDIPDEIDGKPVVQIESNVFSNMQNLESVWIGKNVTIVEREAFMDCPNLKSVEILSPEIELDNYVFSNCESLKRFYAIGVVSLSSGVFSRCKKLEEFTGVIDSLYRSTFAMCKSLKGQLIFADEVYHFSGDAFRGDCGITDLFFPGSVGRFYNMTPSDVNTIVFHCFEGSNICELAYEGYNVVIQEETA